MPKKQNNIKTSGKMTLKTKKILAIGMLIAWFGLLGGWIGSQIVDFQPRTWLLPMVCICGIIASFSGLNAVAKKIEDEKLKQQ